MDSPDQSPIVKGKFPLAYSTFKNFFQKYKTPTFIVLGCAIFLLSFYQSFLSAPANFPKGSIASVEKGAALTQISQSLKEHRIIRSEIAFQFFTILFAGDRRVISGDYYFEDKEPVFEVAYRVSHGRYGLSAKKITIPEGSTVFEMSRILGAKLPYFDAEDFMNQASDKEGYLFPDTYFFFPTAEASEIIKLMSDNFNKKIDSIGNDIVSSGRKLSEIIIMASIIEKEANKDDDRKIVSGILWKRIKLGMALQVDAPFLYINQAADREVTLDDLKINSPYNTYTHRGLTPTPIGNPGLAAIEASAQPKDSPYFYYLHDGNGMIHYAKTFEEHKANKAKYLR